MPSLLAALILNALLAAAALAARAVSASGAATGFALGVLVYVGLGPGGYAPLPLFVILGSAFTRFGYAEKARRGVAQERRGVRTWRNAAANCGVGGLCAAGALLAPGAGWHWAAAGAFAAALADTTESELGVLYGRRAFSPLTGQACAPGTEGALSVMGTLLGLLTALLCAAVAAACGQLPWIAVAPVGVAALAATFIESLVGSARPLSNEILNTLTTAAGAVLAYGAVALTAAAPWSTR
jgi:uncharacterized protein (TIGR00297 family)